MSVYHVPVMLREVLDILQPHNGGVYIDCTVGGSGHALEIIKRIIPDGKLFGIDRDADALQDAEDALSSYSENVILKKGNFSDLKKLAEGLDSSAINGILFDLGVSSHQLETADRGFSFKMEAQLDMRMDAEEVTTAKELVNTLPEIELAGLIWKYGEEKWSRRIAQFIVARRPIETTADLVEAVLAAVPKAARQGGIHPATRTFQALRLAVNRELESLQEGLDAAIHLLGEKGRICVLSYHSLEDRIVKDTFAAHSGRCSCPPALPVCVCGAVKELRIITRRPMLPSSEEIRENPRARSAKLRAAEKF